MVVCFAGQVACPRGATYDLIKSNVDTYAEGIINRTLYPNSHAMWKRLKSEHGEGLAKIVMSETYAVIADILRLTNQYWDVRLALLSGGGVAQVPEYALATRIAKGREAKACALELLANARVFGDSLPGFDYDESDYYPEFDDRFPVIR